MMTKIIQYGLIGGDDVSIVNLTEQIINTSNLSAALVSDNSNQPMIICAGKKHLLPLSMDNTTQHITLLRLNTVTLAMIPLSLKQWEVLEEKYGANKVSHTFLKLPAHPNIFKEMLVRP